MMVAAAHEQDLSSPQVLQSGVAWIVVFRITLASSCHGPFNFSPITVLNHPVAWRD